MNYSGDYLTANPLKDPLSDDLRRVYDTTANFQEESVPTAVVSLHEFCFTAGRTPVEKTLAPTLTQSLTECEEFTTEQGECNNQKPTSAETKQSKMLASASSSLYVGHARPAASSPDTQCLWKCKSNLSCRQTTVSEKDRRKSESEREGGRGREITFDL